MGLRRLIKNWRRKKAVVAIEEIRNLYKTSYGKNVLISYIVHPFLEESFFKHQNYITAHLIAEVFSEMGYNIDVVDFRAVNLDIDYSRYEVIYGFGRAFEQSFYKAPYSIPRIYFNTGAHIDLHNEMSLRSVQDFFCLSDIWLPDEANVSTDYLYYSIFHSAVTIILAKGYIFDDFKNRFPNTLYSLNNNILGVFSHFKPKTIEGRSGEFLFLSGGKQITKGLPILLEVAKRRPELKFHVVVPYINEKLVKYYSDMFNDDSNVDLHVDIRMDSEQMEQIVGACSYCLAPSYIDGFPGGTIEPMSAGLVPIVSKYCGFPAKDFIFEMENLSVEGLIQSIDRVLDLTDEEFLKCSREASEYVNSEFSKESVKGQLMSILTSTLSANQVNSPA